jgi:hypothetical protein
LSEGANGAEHPVDVFTSADRNSDDVWCACADFIGYTFRREKRLVVPRPKIEELPKDYRSKPECLLELSQSFRSVGDYTENKQFLIHTSKLQREGGDGYLVVQTLMFLADTNRRLTLYEEGIQQAKESLGICEGLDHTVGQAHSFRSLAWLLHADNAKGAAS